MSRELPLKHKYQPTGGAAVDEKSGDLESQWDTSSGDYEYLNKMSWQSIDLAFCNILAWAKVLD